MNDQSSELNDAPLTQEEMHAALFAQMVMHFSSTALVLMGHAPNPVTGKTETDLESARLFVDQLEMLQVKTKGNLTREEEHLLKQNLMAVRMAFVQAVEKAQTRPAEESSAKLDTPEAAKPLGEAEAESKKKFSKSYGAA